MSDLLTSAGLEVEGIERLGEKYDGFVVGEVLSVNKHPNADKLSVCVVRVESAGRTEGAGVQVVCGAPNVSARQKVAVGLPGATVPKNQHDPDGKPFVLAKVSIRGVESSGMICSSYELGLGTDSAGILVLDPAAKPGTPLAEYLGIDDIAYEIGVTPNRPDCLSHIGIAREVAASLDRSLRLPDVSLREDKKLPISKAVGIEVKNPDACPRYTARLVTGIAVAPSPSWLNSYLTTCGLRPVNNVVDVGNFVMLEYGQPLHMFDFDRLEAKKIVVRDAAEGERFRTLDGVDHQLDGKALMICDGKKPVAIAGIMGGANSEITEATRSVLIESAFFEKRGIRRTARKLGKSTDASYRFERGTDPNGTRVAVDRAAALLAELGGGTVISGAVDVYPRKIKEGRVRLRVAHVNRVLGSSFVASDIPKLLTPIGIRAQSKGGGIFSCTIPTFRPDIEGEIDLVEEIARRAGYSSIEDKMVSTIDFSRKPFLPSGSAMLRDALEGMGFSEIVTNSLLDAETLRTGWPRLVEVKNPISKDLSALRPSMVYSALQTVAHNANQGTLDLRVYELGRTYAKSQNSGTGTFVKGYVEEEVLSICMTGKREPNSWDSKPGNVDIFDLKGVIATLLGKIPLDKIRFICYDSRSPLTEQTIAVEKNGTYIGFLGKVKADLLRVFSVESDVYVSELSVSALVQGEGHVRKFVSPSRFPSVHRDLAFILEKDVTMESVEAQIRESAGRLLRGIALFDLFEGKPLPSGKKSLAFSLDLNSSERTLTEDEAARVIDGVVRDVRKKFNAELRSS